MIEVILVVMLMLVGMLSTAGSAWLLSLVRQEWRGSWHGHEVVIRNYITNEQLYIDGKLLAEGKSAGLAISQSLPSVITDGDRTVPVLATIHPTNLGMSVGAQLLIDGEPIALERAPIGTFALQQGTTAEAPRDSRWSAVQRLLSDIRTHGHDTEPVIQQTEARLREVLHEISSFSERLEAHQTLDDACNHDGASAMMALRDRQEDLVRGLIAALQQLHLAVLEGKRSATEEAFHGLQAHLLVEAELHDDRPERMRRIQAAQRQKV